GPRWNTTGAAGSLSRVREPGPSPSRQRIRTASASKSASPAAPAGPSARPSRIAARSLGARGRRIATSHTRYGTQNSTTASSAASPESQGSRVPTAVPGGRVREGTVDRGAGDAGFVEPPGIAQGCDAGGEARERLLHGAEDGGVVRVCPEEAEGLVVAAQQARRPDRASRERPERLALDRALGGAEAALGALQECDQFGDPGPSAPRRGSAASDRPTPFPRRRFGWPQPPSQTGTFFT